VAAVTFGGAAGGENFELAGGFTFGGDFFAQDAAGIGFAVESLGDGSWPSGVAEEKDFDFEIATVVGDAEHVSDADLARWFGGLVVGLNSA
jgi:hypothetical protein